MSNQINEGAARYKTDNGGTNSPMPSDSRAPAAGKEQRSPQQLVTDHLDLWTSTVTPKPTSGRGRGSGKSSKLELTGIKKLRELILELAVRGKLVAQNPDDEPASKLLERIEAEKAQLIKDAKLKKQKPLAPISEGEKPFELPEGWEWERLGALSHVITKGTTPTSVGYTFTNSGVNFLKIENLNRGRIDKASISQFISDETNEALSRSQLEAGDIVFSIAGTIGKTAIIYEEDLPANTNQALAIIRGTGSVFDQTFLRIQLDSFVAEKTRNRARGGAMPNVSLGDLSVLAAPIPPLAEQQRIVAKVDELMALCDQLEQQSEHQLTAHQQLTDTLLATLTDSADAQELNDNWQRLAQHFDLLFSGPMGAWAIDRLKDTILQLAVMGKLVPQNPDDEPASKLLERIEEEKARLVKEGKIKNPKKLPSVSDGEKPFELPEGWEWVRLSHIGTFSGGKTPSKARSEYWDGDIPWVSPKDMKTAHIQNSADCVTIEAIEDGLELYPPETILTVVRSGILRHTLPVAITKVHCSINQDIKALKLHIPKLSTYVHLLLKGFESFILSNLTKTGTTVESVKVEEFMNQAFIIPPVAEQQRIAAKVDELFALCDQLKERLHQASETEQHLTNAIVEQALN